MKRRHLLAAGGAGLVAACAADRDTAGSVEAAADATPRRPVVLVHGAWHGGWCWRLVAERLAARGHAVYAPTLTGLGERSHLREPVPSLATHVDDIVNVIEWNELDGLVLVGHSYGGMVVTGVADRLAARIHHLVYLDAALPADGETMITQNPATRDPAVVAAVAEQLAALAPDGRWMAPLPPVVFGIPPERADLVAWLERRLTPHPLRTWTDPVSVRAGVLDPIAKTYVHCVAPRLEPSAFAEHARRTASGEAGPNWRSVELATGHDAMLTDPDGVAAILETAAA
jgi:pimeloyl-ACP methyl ester carboxylesterase